MIVFVADLEAAACSDFDGFGNVGNDDTDTDDSENNRDNGAHD